MTLKTYKWPGNIRELENVIKRAIVLAKDKIIHPEHLPIEITGKLLEQSQKKLLTLDDIEKNHILETLKIITDPKQAAKTLGISTTTLWRKRKKYKI
jgi:NtrC-family two-component system response regulator AlgB